MLVQGPVGPLVVKKMVVKCLVAANTVINKIEVESLLI